MEKRDICLIEIETTFNMYCRWAYGEVSSQQKVYRKNGGSNCFDRDDDRFFSNVFTEQLLAASEIPDADLNNINRAISRTAAWLKDYQYKYALNNASTIGDIRRAIEQLGSIYKISFAYPENATKRAIALRPKTTAQRTKKEPAQ